MFHDMFVYESDLKREQVSLLFAHRAPEGRYVYVVYMSRHVSRYVCSLVLAGRREPLGSMLGSDRACRALGRQSLMIIGRSGRGDACDRGEDHVIGGSLPAVASVLWAAFGGCQHIRCRKEKWPRRARDSGRGQGEGRGDQARGAAPRSSSSSSSRLVRLVQARMGGGRSCQVRVP